MAKSNFNLNPNKYLSSCDSRDVISFDARDPIYIRKLFTLIPSALEGQVTNTIANLIIQKLERKCDANLWFKDGENCELLKADSFGWKKGKIKLKINLTLEFIPDEPEEDKSPLDDVRQELDRNDS